MRVYGNPGGVFRQTLHFESKEIDQMCVDALKAAGLLPDTPSAIRIDRFIEKHFKTQIAYEDVDVGVLGCTVFEPNGKIKVVAVSPAISADGSISGKRRERSTLAHEAGHCLMHPTLFMDDGTQSMFTGAGHENLDFKQRRILCRDDDFRRTTRRYDGRWWEYHANRAIGGLLLPKKLVEKCVDGLLATTGGLGMKSLPPTAREQGKRLVATTFDVNPIVAEIRLGEMYPHSGQIEL